MAEYGEWIATAGVILYSFASLLDSSTLFKKSYITYPHRQDLTN